MKGNPSRGYRSVRARCGTRQIEDPSSPCSTAQGPYTAVVPLALKSPPIGGCKSSETSRVGTGCRLVSVRAQALSPLALLALRGNRDLDSRPPCLGPARRTCSATAGLGRRHHRSYVGQRVARRTARRTPAVTPTARVAVAGHMALAAVALFRGPAARATRSTPARWSACLGVPARRYVRSVSFLRAAAHRRRRR